MRNKSIQKSSATNPNIACGWSVNARGTIWHSGSNAFMVRLKNGLSWAALIDTSGKESLSALNALMWKIAGVVVE